MGGGVPGRGIGYPRARYSLHGGGAALGLRQKKWILEGQRGRSQRRAFQRRRRQLRFGSVVIIGGGLILLVLVVVLASFLLLR